MQNNKTTVGLDRFLQRINYLLARSLDTRLCSFGNRLACDGDTVTMQIAAFQEAFNFVGDPNTFNFFPNVKRVLINPATNWAGFTQPFVQTTLPDGTRKSLRPDALAELVTSLEGVDSMGFRGVLPRVELRVDADVPWSRFVDVAIAGCRSNVRPTIVR